MQGMSSEFAPRLVIEWDTDERKFHARRPLGENGAGNYMSIREHQALCKELVEALEPMAKALAWIKTDDLLTAGRTWSPGFTGEEMARARSALEAFRRGKG